MNQWLGGFHTLCDGVKRAFQIFALLDCQHYVGDHHQHCGNLLTPAVVRLVARFSRTVSQRRTARKEVVDRFVAYLAADAQRIVSAKIDVLHQLLWSILIQIFAFSAIVSDFGILTIFGALLTGYNVYALRESIQLYGYARDAAEQNADPPESQPPNPPFHPTKGSTPLPSTTDGDSVTSPEESAALRP